MARPRKQTNFIRAGVIHALRQIGHDDNTIGDVLGISDRQVKRLVDENTTEGGEITDETQS